MEIFVKLCSIMVMDALVSGMWTSIASGSGLARTRLGTDSSRLNQEFGNRVCRMAVVAMTCFMDTTTTHVDTSHNFSRVNLSQTPLDHKE